MGLEPNEEGGCQERALLLQWRMIVHCALVGGIGLLGREVQCWGGRMQDGWGTVGALGPSRDLGYLGS